MDKDDFSKRMIIGTFCAVMLLVFGGMLAKVLEHGTNSDEAVKTAAHAFDMILVSLTSYLGGLAVGKGEVTCIEIGENRTRLDNV